MESIKLAGENDPVYKKQKENKDWVHENFSDKG